MKQPESNEAIVLARLEQIFAKIGFNVRYSDVDRKVPSADFLAQKRVGNSMYKIAIELKGNSNYRDAVKYGVRTLIRVNELGNFDRLLLLISDSANGNASNSSSNLLTEYPTNLEIKTLRDLEEWSANLAKELDTQETNRVFSAIRTLCRTLIKLIAENPNYLASLEWRDLERSICEAFEGIGFSATLTPPSKDGGKDVILECRIDDINKSFIVEIKHWRSGQKVGQSMVRDFTNVIINEKREKGLMLSTYGFTGNYYECLSEKQRSVVAFGGQDKIVEIFRTYERLQNGILNPIENLEDTLFNHTQSVNEF